MKKNKKLDLNVWEGQYVRLTIKNTSMTTELDDGSVIESPYTIDGLFVWWDKDSSTIHLNTLNNDPAGISMSLHREMVGMIELLPPEMDTENDNSRFIN